MRNSSETRRLPHARVVAAVAVVVALAAVVGPFGTNASGQPSASAGGFDFFSTDSHATMFKFQGPFVIPAGFFGVGSSPFSGTVSFKGHPIGTFRNHKVGNADTIVERKHMPDLHPPFPSEGTTDVELVALSFESTQPIRVQVGNRIELWDVKAQPSPSRASTGTMTITQRNEQGGTASSKLTVYVLFTFVALKGGEQKQLDVGSQDLSPAAVAGLTLEANNIQWLHKCPPGFLVVPDLSDNFCLSPAAEQAKWASHHVTRALP